MNPEPPTALRPRDFALLLLASRDLRPRKRARDQQADRAGLEMKRRILEEVAAIDPEPNELETALLRIALGLDKPSGPTRAVASLIQEEWRMACAVPEWVAQLLADAVEMRAAPHGESQRG